MLTKIHGFVLFIPIVGYLLIRRQYVKIGILVCVAFVVFIAGWPWLWTNTTAHIVEYLQMQMGHSGVTEYIFGKTYTAAPSWYTPVIFLTTTPVFVLVFFFIGVFWTVKKGKHWDRIILFNAVFPIVFFMLPGVQRYDWVRLFLPAFPFICLIAGRGIMLLKKYLFIIVVLWLVTVYVSVVRIHPWESAYYNELVGGISGARTLGMESEFWGNGYLGVLPWMNSHKADMMCVPFTMSAVNYYQSMGQIEAGVVFGATGDACRYMILLMRQGYIMRDSAIMKLVKEKSPIYAVRVDGVSLVNVYDLKHE